MKLNELRVGNAYLSTKWRRPVICDLTDFYELYERADGAYDDPPVNEIFEPLPIVRHELIRLGFKEEDMMGFNGGWSHHTSNRYFIQQMANATTIFTDDGDYTALISGFNYVHELQDMWFSLTGKELTYNIEDNNEIPS